MEPRNKKTKLQEVEFSNTRRHRGGLDGMSAKQTEILSVLGLKVGAEQESRVLSLLRAILRIQKDPPVPLEFSQIYASLKEEKPQAKLTKAWVHRVLKSLVDMKLIRVESPSSYRKMYIADVNTILSGLEKLKEDVTQSTYNQIAELQKNVEKIDGIDTKNLAQDLAESLTGKKQVLSSRFIQGLEEFHRVTENTMFSVAKPGDTIRTSLMAVEPYLTDDIEKRMVRIFTAAARGVAIRYSVPADIFVIDKAISEGVSQDWIVKAMTALVALIEKGAPIDIRLNASTKKGYQFVSLNDESMAFMLTQRPVTAAWITRDFNPDLIDTAISGFDELWEQSRSITDFTQEDMQALGSKPNGVIASALTEGKEKAEKGDLGLMEEDEE
ncbi:MAG: hypothetical protein ACXAAP_01840 [Candidatus Thorarchaeota archaeon]|jgi:Fe2+ or Zn2+ uptake regulation protein